MKSPLGYIIHEESTESGDSKIIGMTAGRPIGEGILQDANVVNRNGRIYSDKDLYPEINGERMIELIESGQMKGELGHPQDKDIARQQIIDPKVVCVKYLKIWTEGNDIRAQFTGTNNDYGRDFNADLLDGEKPSFSLRALGSIENIAGKAMVKNIRIITWDRVIYPSHKRAYTERLVTESAVDGTPISKNKVVFNKTDSSIIPVTNKEVMDYIKQESANLKTISKRLDMWYDTMELLEGGSKVQLLSKDGDILVVNLESYIKKEIRDYFG